MNRSILKQLLKKDIYMSRHFIIGSVSASVVSLVIATMGTNGYNLGSLAFLTNMIALGIFVGMYGVIRERENKSWLFVLSLPISYTQYSLAKTISSLVIYLIPWSVSLLTGLLVIVSDDGIPQGLIPAFVILMCFLLQNFFIFLSVVLSVKSEAWIVTAIIITNTSVSVFLQFIFDLPTISQHITGGVAVWSPELLLTVLIEFVLMALVLGVALTFQFKKKDVL